MGGDVRHRANQRAQTAAGGKAALKARNKGETHALRTKLIASLAVSLAIACCFWLWRGSSKPKEFLDLRPVPVLDCKSSAGVVCDPAVLEVFFEKFHLRSPVILKGSLEHWPAMATWDANYLASSCPAARLPAYEYDPGSSEWAALRDLGEMSATEYLTSQFIGQRNQQRLLYALEMSIRSECPRLLEDIRIPAIFSDDMLVRYYEKTSWPTGIFGPKGTQSGLHRDSHNFPFYMALFRGRKRWRIFDFNDESLNRFYESTRNGFGFDAFAPDFGRLPGLEHARPYEAILEPGDLIYIPNGAPHAAQNLEDTFAISGNYLDKRSLGFHRNVTCASSLWMNSNLCWGYDGQFDAHKKPSLDALREKSYYEFAGYDGKDSWCTGHLHSIQSRLSRSKNPDVIQSLERHRHIVGQYCS